MSKELKNQFNNSTNPLVVVDIGASGGLHQRWEKSQFSYRGILFEPDPREYDKLKASLPDTYKVYNVALSDKEEELNLHLCKKQMCSSVLPPNSSLIELFPEHERFDVIKKVKMKANALDNVLINEPYIDFIKIDAEASELPILKGAEKTLEGTLGLEVESAFCQVRENQAVFRDVDKFLSERDFTLIDIRQDYWQRKEGYPHSYHKGQVIWCDALYFRTPEYIMQHYAENDATIIRMILLYISYGYYDLGQSLVNYAAKNRSLKSQDLADLARLLKKQQPKIHIPNFRGRYKLSSILHFLTWKLRSSSKWSRGELYLGNK